MEDQIVEYQRTYNLAVQSLQSNKEVLAIFVFGSMVSGDLWEKSDIDFFVIMKKWPPGMTNVHSTDLGKPVHYKFLSKKEFMNSKGFDLKGSFLHRLFASSRLVNCRDRDIEERFNAGRAYTDQSRKIWTLTYFGKVIKGTDSIRKSLKNSNELAAYVTLMDTMNWYAMVLINEGGYMVSKDNINIAAELFPDFREAFTNLVAGGDLKKRVEDTVSWILREMDRKLRDLTEVLFQYLRDKDRPLSANEIQEDPLLFPYRIEMEAILALLYEKKLLKRNHRDFLSQGAEALVRENVYFI